MQRDLWLVFHINFEVKDMMVRKIYNKYISIILPMSVLIIIGLIMLFGKRI